MTILAFEFSSPQRSVALARAGRVLSETVEIGERKTNAFAMTEKILAEAKIEREEVETIAIGLGPGSYTGIRAAIALAQGWQLARRVKLPGVSSVECLAAQAVAQKIFGRVNVVIDAQRNEFYLATYQISSAGWREIEPLRILTFKELQAISDMGEILIGPEVTRRFPGGQMIFPSAAALAHLAANRDDFVAGEKLEPIYLRETNFIKTPPRNPVAL